MKNYLRLFGLLLVILLAAYQSTPQPFEENEAFKLACENAGGAYQAFAAYGGGVKEVCQFPDGLSCVAEAFANGSCPPLGPTPAALALDPTPTPYPTKDQSPPVTPIVKGADPFPGWATYLNSEYDFAFRYPDTWQVEAGAGLVRLTRPGMELLVRVSPADDPHALSLDLPYQGARVTGPGASFFGADAAEMWHQVDDRIVAVTYGSTEQPLRGGENWYTVQLVSLQSDAPLPDDALAELRTLLASFEVWTNHD